MNYLLLTAFLMASDAPVATQTCQKHPCLVAGSLEGSITMTDTVAVDTLVKGAASDKADAVLFSINSGGGDYGASKEIYRLIKTSPVPFYCYVTDMAASGAFWILQACKERVAEPDAILMVHQGSWTFTAASYSRADIATILSQLDAKNEIMLTSIASRMRMKPQDLTARCSKGDWFMSAPGAVAVNAADSVFTAGPEAYVKHVKDLISKH